MRRRDALEALGGTWLGLLAGLTGGAGLAGCLERVDGPDALEHDDAWRRLVVDPPDGIYVPPKVDEMVSYGSTTVGGREIALLATRPHSFWTVTGDERNRSDVRSGRSIHLMARVRDVTSNVVVPATVAVRLRRDGERVDRRTLWPMLSQRMGFHYGDNVALEDGGTYDATVHVGPADCRTTGAFADRLERPVTTTFELEYNPGEIESLDRTLLDGDEGRGERGALEPMTGGEDGSDNRPASVAPPLESLPGERIGVATDERVGVASGGDLEVPVTVLEGFRTVTDGPYLALIPRTAYNGYCLPFATLSVAGRRDGNRVFRTTARETLDPDLGHHYGVAVDAAELDRTAELEVAVGVPQLARHEGYETAFLERERETVTLSDDG